MKKIIISLKKINYKLFLALLVLGLCPTFYTTLRVFFLGELPGEYSFSIAGQLSWVNLLYEILSETIVLPLFFFIGKVLTDKQEFSNRMRTGLIVSVSAYTLLSIVIIALAKPLLTLMATDLSIIDASATYEVTFDNSRATTKISGYDMINNGIKVNLPCALSSELVIYKKI